MGVEIQALLTNALGLQAPWSVKEVKLDTTLKRIDFNLTCNALGLPCPSAMRPLNGFRTDCSVSGATLTSSSTKPGYTPMCPE